MTGLRVGLTGGIASGKTTAAHRFAELGATVIDADEVAQFLRGRPGVHDVHDLHIWGMSTTENALTAHLVMPAGYPGDEVLDSISEGLRTRFCIGHSTLQVEQGTTRHACALHAAH